jgi:predicted NBD/HSP70 family sugar kinase
VDGSLRRLGLDLGATDIKFALLDDEVVVETGSSPTRSARASRPCAAGWWKLGHGHGVETVGLRPGLVDAEGRAVLFPNMWRWASVQLAGRCRASAAVALRTTATRSHWPRHVAAPPGLADVICVMCGTGSAVVSSQASCGHRHRAGEIGHHGAPRG